MSRQATRAPAVATAVTPAAVAVVDRLGTLTRSRSRTGLVNCMTSHSRSLRHLGQHPVGVDGHRVADRLEHRQVGVGVRVRGRLRQVEALRLGQRPHGLGLERAVGVELHLPRVAALLVHDGPGGDAAVDAEVLGQGLDDLLG